MRVPPQQTHLPPWHTSLHSTAPHAPLRLRDTLCRLPPDAALPCPRDVPQGSQVLRRSTVVCLDRSWLVKPVAPAKRKKHLHTGSAGASLRPTRRALVADHVLRLYGNGLGVTSGLPMPLLGDPSIPPCYRSTIHVAMQRGLMKGRIRLIASAPVNTLSARCVHRSTRP
jgi:hypothetical protein